MIKIHLKLPEPDLGRAKYTLRWFALGWGIPIEYTSEENADLFYGRGINASGRALGVAYDPKLYQKETLCQAKAFAGRKVWQSIEPIQGEPDLIGGAYRLLTLLDECEVKESDRNRMGIFRTTALSERRQAISHLPIAEHHAELLLESLLQRFPRLKEQQIPRWPKGKKVAVVVSHDTDMVSLQTPKEIATNAVKFFTRRESTYAEMLWDGLWPRKGINEADIFGFPKWRDWENSRKIKSCFFVYVHPSNVPTTLHDCKSSVLSKGVSWDLFKELVDEGWEFGVHAPIRAKENSDWLADCKVLTESKLGRPVFGVRHHYWALDWRNPTNTFRKHEKSGYSYDSSMAWRDAAGFRAGSSLPYQPFDESSGETLGLYELPTSLMDGHIVDGQGIPSEDRLAKALALVEGVKARGGVLTINWHTESGGASYRYSQYPNLLQKVIAGSLSSDEAWFATPNELIEHWKTRAQKIERETSAIIL